ncbi:MAG: pseudouridine synthase, partial [Campylobacter sp.]|nr:pseudouridine synthase [Campylobacter sp.]
MGYELVKIGFAKNERVFSALKRLGFSMKKAQNLCDKGRILGSSARTLAKNELFSGELFMIDYVCYPKGLEPVFETDDFAVFDKPSGICSHPNGRNSPYNMYDEIWHLYGREACVAHRLDAETSGLLLVAKTKNSAKELKALFEERKVLKSYLALVRGDLRSAGLRQFCAD